MGFRRYVQKCNLEENVMPRELWCQIIKMRRSELHSAKERDKAVPRQGTGVQAGQQSPALGSRGNGGTCKGYWLVFQKMVGFITYFVQHFFLSSTELFSAQLVI